MEAASLELEKTVEELRAELETYRALHGALAERTSETERRLHAIFELAPIGIGLVDARGRTIMSNRAVQQMLGYTDAEFATTPFVEFTHPDDAERNLVLFSQLMEGRIDRFEMDKRFVHKDGGIVWARLSVSLIPTPEGRPQYALGMVENITTRKQLEEKLREAQKMDAIGRLAGGIAHDFNNLLFVIQNSARFLTEELRTTDPRRADAEEILHAGGRAAELVHQLLTFSRREVVDPQVLDIRDVIADVERLLARSLGEHVRLTTRLAGDLYPVEVDRAQMEQVFINLALNARDAMPESGSLVIEAHNDGSHPDGDRWVIVKVTDDGIGMDENTRSRAFEPFFTTKPRGSGTGLGLATVFGTITRAGGKVEIDTIPGRGTTFEMRFPAATVAALTDPETGPPRERHERPIGTVLVAEDEAGVRKVVSRILERNGFRVLVAASGTEALALADHHSATIDVLVTDLLMPDVSGRELAAAVTEMNPGIRLVYMSGYSDDVLTEHSTPAPERFLQKPFTEDQLLEILREMLGSLDRRRG